MKNKKTVILSAVLALSILNVTVASVYAENNSNSTQLHGDWNHESNRLASDRILNSGTFQEIEHGQNPVVVSPSRIDGSQTITSGLSSGFLSNSSTDNSNILYNTGAPVLNSPTPYFVWYGNWDSSHQSTSPLSVSGLAEGMGTFQSGKNSISVSLVTGAISIGQTIVGSGIPSGTTVTSVTGSTINISKTTTSAGSSTGLIFKSGINTPADYYQFNSKAVSDLSTSARWTNIIKNYYSRASGSSNSVQNKIGNLNSIAGNVFISTNIAKYGSILSQSAIRSIANDAVPNPISNAIILVITSADIPVTGFNSGVIQFCGWHSWSGTVAYGFVGDSSNATWCQGQSAPTPNGNVGADSYLNVLTHEIEEATTDPLLNAWYSQNGNENADKCAWSYGVTGNSNVSNYTWNGSNYLIQQEFKLNSGKMTSSKDTWTGACTR